MKEHKQKHMKEHGHMKEHSYGHGKESMARAGYEQGDMSPKVDDYQMPMKDFAEHDFSKTTKYIERQDRQQSENKHQVSKQAYQGRYS